MNAEIPWIAAIYFSFWVIFGSFFLVNIILAVILDSFTKVQKENYKNQISKEFMSEIQKQIEKDREEMKESEEEKLAGSSKSIESPDIKKMEVISFEKPSSSWLHSNNKSLSK